MSLPEKIVEGIEKLEPLPITVQKLLSTLNDEEMNFSEISAIIEYDGAITSNILRTANSAAFGGLSPINHVRDAVVRLGTITLLDILLMGHLRSMKIAAPMYDMSEDELWLHGATASLAVKALIRETHNRQIPEATTIAALIHDIGKLIIVRYASADISTILAVCQENNLTFVQAEQELLGCDHAEVGGAIARKWSFPPSITATIEQHHEVSPQEPTLMLDSVMVANMVAKAIGLGAGGPGMNLSADWRGSGERIGLTSESYDRVCTQTASWMEDLKTSYGIRN